MQVFISVQRIRNKRQTFILDSILDILYQAGAAPLILNRDATEAFSDPMMRIREALVASDAVIVIAFARTAAERVTEFPGDPYGVTHQSRRYCSVWNQIEAAMAYQAGLPLLVFQDDDLFQQGAINIRRTAYPVVKLTQDSSEPALHKHIVRTLEPWLRGLAHP